MMCGWFFCFGSVSSLWGFPLFWCCVCFNLGRWAQRLRLTKTLSTVRAAAAAFISSAGRREKITIERERLWTKEAELKNVWVGTNSHKRAISGGLTVDHKTTLEMDSPTWLLLWSEAGPSGRERGLKLRGGTLTIYCPWSERTIKVVKTGLSKQEQSSWVGRLQDGTRTFCSFTSSV